MGKKKISEARLTSDVKRLNAKIMSLNGAQEHVTERQKKATQELSALGNRLSNMSVNAHAGRKQLLHRIQVRFERLADLTRATEEITKKTRGVQIELVEKQARLFLEREQRAMDNDVVHTVFALRTSIDEETKKFEDYVDRYIMPTDEENPHLSYVSNDNLRKVVVSRTTRTLIRESGAAEALALVHEFFEKFEKNVHLKPEVRAVYELTEKILVERRGFRVGPGLYDFLKLDFVDSAFPELRKAQEILRESLYTQTSSRYVRLYERQSADEKWVAR